MASQDGQSTATKPKETEVMPASTGNPYEITIGAQSINIASAPGTGAAANKLRLWLNGEKNLHENADCVKVRAASQESGLSIWFQEGSHTVNGEAETHEVYGFIQVEKNGVVIVPNQKWSPAVKTSPLVVGDLTIDGDPQGGISIRLAGEKVGDIVKFDKLYWLTPSGRPHEFDHGDPNVVIKVVNDLNTTEAYPDC